MNLDKDLDSKLIKKIDRFLKLRPRSTKELSDYLKFRRKQAPSKIDKYIHYYEELGIISDERFCEWFLLNRLNSSKYGLDRIKQELIQKGISKNLYLTTVNRLGEDKIKKENFSKLLGQIESELNNKQDIEPDAKNKIISKFVRRGFSYDLIKKAWNY